MKLKILTPEKLVLERHVDSVTLPGKSGQLTVMLGHDLLAALLKPGILYFKWMDDDRKVLREDYETGEGIAEITKTATRVFVSRAKKTVVE